VPPDSGQDGDENEQTEAVVGKLAGETELSSRHEPEIVRDADVDAAGAILNRKALIERLDSNAPTAR
jgi:hypothetical protein